MIILAQMYIAICTLYLAGKDASSYLLKNKEDGLLTKDRIKRWHRDGVILFLLYVLSTLTTLYFSTIHNWWMILVYSALIRLSLFDLGFNKWAGLDVKFLGSTSKVDQIFVKIFGKNGAVKKSIFFLIVLIILNIFLN